MLDANNNSAEISKDGYPRFGTAEETDMIASLNSADSTSIVFKDFAITGSIYLCVAATLTACAALLSF